MLQVPKNTSKGHKKNGQVWPVIIFQPFERESVPMLQRALENTHWQALTIKKTQKLVVKHWLKAHVCG